MAGGNTLPNVPPQASQDFQISVLNQVIDYINQQQRTQTIGDGTTSRFIFGYQQGGWPGGDFGIKISPPGVDVTTAPLEDLLFYWDFSNGTQYWYDPNTGKNYMQIGILPTGVGGFAVARTGYNVAEGF